MPSRPRARLAILSGKDLTIGIFFIFRLAYWSLFGLAALLDQFSDFLLAWMPFYYVAKLAFFIYLALPQTYGAAVLFKSFIRPVMFSGNTVKSE